MSITVLVIKKLRNVLNIQTIVLLFIRSCIWSYVCLFILSFFLSFVYSFLISFVCSFARSFTFSFSYNGYTSLHPTMLSVPLNVIISFPQRRRSVGEWCHRRRRVRRWTGCVLCRPTVTSPPTSSEAVATTPVSAAASPKTRCVRRWKASVCRRTNAVPSPTASPPL